MTIPSGLACATLSLSVATGCGSRYVDALELRGCEASSAEGEPAKPSSEFVDSLGISVHPQFADTLYGDYAGMMRDLARLRIRHVHDNALGAESDPEPYRRMREHGVQVTLQLNTASDPARLARDLGGALEAVQVPQPGDAGSLAPPLSETEANTQAVFEAVQQISEELRPRVIGPRLARRAGADEVGDLSPWLDAGATWFGYQPPGSSALGSTLALDRRWFDDLPLIATPAAGFPLRPGSEPVVSERVQAKYVLRSFLELFRRGVRRSYYSGLYDAGDAQESKLVSDDGEPRPSFLAMEALSTLLEDDGPAFQASRLSFHVTGLASESGNLRQLLLQRSSGIFLLVTWLEVESTDDDQLLAATVEFPQAIRGARIADLEAGTERPVPINSRGAFDIAVSDMPSVLVIDTGCAR